MFEKCLNEAEAILNSHKDTIVPIRAVWDEMLKRAKIKGFEPVSLSDFTALLEGDRRFQILPAKNSEDDGMDDIDEFGDTEMEQMGFYPEDRVRLRSSVVDENAALLDDDEEISSIRVRGLVGGDKKQASEKENKSLRKKSTPRIKSTKKKASSKKKKLKKTPPKKIVKKKRKK